MWGVSSVLGALETLVPQAFGAGRFRRVGVVLQRSFVVCVFLAAFVALLWLPVQPALIAVGLGDSAPDAQTFLYYSMPGMLPFMLYGALFRWLNGQGVVWPAVFHLIFGNAAHVGFCYVFVHGAGGFGGYGYIGAPIALSVSWWVWTVTFALLIVARGDHKRTWFGCECSAAINGTGLRDFMALGIPAGLMVIFETLGYEALTIMSGYLPQKQTDLAAMSVVSSIYLLFWTVYLGYNAAASITVGQLLGAGEPLLASRAAYYSMVMTILTAGATGTALHLLAPDITRLLTAEPAVQKLAEETLRVAAWVNAVDVFQTCCCGVLMGTGEPMWGTVANLLGYFGVSLPVAYALGFHAEMGLRGLFFGLLCAVSVVGALTSARILCSDWARLSVKARRAAGASVGETTPMLSPSQDSYDGDTVFLDRSAESHSLSVARANETTEALRREGELSGRW